MFCFVITESWYQVKEKMGGVSLKTLLNRCVRGGRRYCVSGFQRGCLYCLSTDVWCNVVSSPVCIPVLWWGRCDESCLGLSVLRDTPPSHNPDSGLCRSISSTVYRKTCKEDDRATRLISSGRTGQNGTCTYTSGRVETFRDTPRKFRSVHVVTYGQPL